MMTEK